MLEVPYILLITMLACSGCLLITSIAFNKIGGLIGSSVVFMFVLGVLIGGTLRIV